MFTITSILPTSRMSKHSDLLGFNASYPLPFSPKHNSGLASTWSCSPTRPLLYSSRVSIPRYSMCLSPPSTTTPSPAEIEKAYRDTKVAYKQAKAAYKALRKQNESKEKEAYKRAKAERKRMKKAQENMSMTPSITATIPENGDTMITVCGGKSCGRMGADIVEQMLRKKKGVQVVAGASCMKMCGGQGPSLQIGETGEVVKVDFKNAIMSALETDTE